MPPMKGNKKFNWFEFIHEFSQAEPHFIPIFDFLRNKNIINFRNYPYPLIVLATSIQKEYEVKIFNFLDNKTSIKDIIKFYPDIIGFSCSTSSNLMWIDNISRLLKKRLGCTIILGGPHITLSPQQSLETTVADYILIGESDFTLLDVLKYIDGKKKKLPKEGVGYRKKGKSIITPASIIRDLSKLPIPDHTFLELDKYKCIHIETSRGCIFKCPFCFLSGYGRKVYWRGRPIHHILRELNHIQDIVDIEDKKIYFVDSNFRNNTRIKKMMKTIVQEKIKTTFWTASDMSLNYETLKWMKKAGFSFIHTGIESGSHRFTELEKLRNLNYILNYFRKMKKIEIMPGADFILMYPGETKKDIIETLNMAEKISDISTYVIFQPHLFRPFPNTIETKKLINKGWYPPISFYDWGKLFDEISKGDFKRANFTKNVNKKFLVKVLFKFANLNMKTFILPWAKKLLFKRKYL
jgi:radical SAM superfamily enzyme YgiQ (UPF0313 family)